MPCMTPDLLPGTMLTSFYPSERAFALRDSPAVLAWGYATKARGLVAVLGPDRGPNTAVYGAWMCKVLQDSSHYGLLWKGRYLFIDICEVQGDARSISERVGETLHALQNPPDDHKLEERKLDEEPDAEGLLFWLFGDASGHREGQKHCTLAGLREFWNEMLRGVRVDIAIFSPDEGEARKVVQSAEEILNCRTMLPDKIRYPDLSLPERFDFVCEVATNERFNEVTSFFHVGSDMFLSACWLLESMAQALLSVWEDMTLETKILGCNIWFQVQIRDDEMSTDDLSSCIRQFLAEMHVLVAMLALLAPLEEDDWERLQFAAQSVLQPAKDESCNREMVLLLMETKLTGDFSDFPWSALRPAGASLQEAIECFNKYLSPASETRACLSIHVSQANCYSGKAMEDVDIKRLRGLLHRDE